MTTIERDLPNIDLRVSAALIRARRELEEVNGFIHAFYLASSDDGADAGRNAFEALLRTVANLTLALEGIDERLTREIQCRRVLSGRFDAHEDGETS